MENAALVCLHIDRGTGAVHFVTEGGGGGTGNRRRWGAAIRGSRQDGLADLVLSLVEQEVGSIGLRGVYSYKSHQLNNIMTTIIQKPRLTCSPM